MKNDLVEKRFGYLIAKYPFSKLYSGKKRTFWICECISGFKDCKGKTEVLRESLLRGLTRSCGCYNDKVRRTQYMISSGDSFGFLTTVSYERKGKKLHWFCKCDSRLPNCTKTCLVRADNLRSGKTKSCGCFHLYQIKKYNKDRDFKYLYKTWDGIKQRCNNKHNNQYKNYGGRGINIYYPWEKSFTLFSNYVRLNLGKRPTGYSLDRYPDNNGNYEPGNIRWATDEEQNQNTTRNVLTEKMVKEMRMMNQEGVSGDNIAAHFNINPWTCRDVLSYKTWKNIL